MRAVPSPGIKIAGLFQETALSTFSFHHTHLVLSRMIPLLETFRKALLKSDQARKTREQDQWEKIQSAVASSVEAKPFLKFSKLCGPILPPLTGKISYFSLLFYHSMSAPDARRILKERQPAMEA